MKQKLLLFAGICCITVSAFATTHVITVGAGGGTSFTPASIPTVALGDTVEWVWATGTHTTTSTSVPATAANWDQPITSSATSYKYKPTLVGTYNYQCTPHAGMGMTGSFVVSTPTGINAPGNEQLFGMYPNPARQNVHLTFSAASPASVVLTDLNGRIIKKAEYKNVNTADISIEGIANGIYVMSVIQGGSTKKQELVIAQ